MTTILERLTGKPLPAAASPPRWSALSSLGWPVSIRTSIEAVQAQRGSGFLRSTYPNVLAVLKAGPGHKAAGQVTRVLEQLAKAPASASLPAASPTKQGGTREGAGEVPTVPRPWSSLTDLDEAARLSTQIDSLVASHCAGLYAEKWVIEFRRAVASRSIKRARVAYCAAVERWLEMRAILSVAQKLGRK